MASSTPDSQERLALLHGTLAQLRSAEGDFELDRVSAQHWGSSSDSAEDGSDYGL